MITGPTRTPERGILDDSFFYDALCRRDNLGKGQEPLSLPQKIKLRELRDSVNGFIPHAHDQYGVDLLHHVPEPTWKHIPLDEWHGLPSHERRIHREEARGHDLADRLFLPSLKEIPHGKALDIGVGSGVPLAYLQKKDGLHSWHGVDLEGTTPEDMCGKSCDRRKLPNFREYDPNGPLPYADHEFEVVLLNNVLHNVPEKDQAAFIQDVRRIVKPGGKILVLEEFTGTTHDDRKHARAVKCTDALFYPKYPSEQRPLAHWEKQFAGLDIEKQRYVGLVNIVGMPTVENFYQLRNRE
ncbi:MAG: class I SAM-dependent methyltransferase [Rickettsiales bacterium]|nr:class I SAM-dependent methyltransferase [Rickettsiales bacterium]